MSMQLEFESEDVLSLAFDPDLDQRMQRLLMRGHESFSQNPALEFTRRLFNVPINVVGVNRDGDGHQLVTSPLYPESIQVTTLIADLNDITRADLPEELKELTGLHDALISAHNKIGFELKDRRRALIELQRAVIQKALDTLGDEKPLLDMTHQPTRYALELYTQALERKFSANSNSGGSQSKMSPEEEGRFWLETGARLSPFFISNAFALLSRTPGLALLGHAGGTAYALASGYWSNPGEANSYLRLLRANSLLNTPQSVVDKVVSLESQHGYDLQETQVLPLLAQMAHIAGDIDNKTVTITPFGHNTLGGETEITSMFPTINMQRTLNPDLEVQDHVVVMVDTLGNTHNLSQDQYRRLLANAQLVEDKNGHKVVLVAGLVNKKWTIQCLDIAQYILNASQLYDKGLYTRDDYSQEGFEEVRSKLNSALLRDHWERIAREHSGAVPPHRSKTVRDTIFLNLVLRTTIHLASKNTLTKLPLVAGALLFDVLTLLAAYNILGDSKASRVLMAGENIQNQKRKR